jgi:hypothetical protein
MILRPEAESRHRIPALLVTARGRGETSFMNAAPKGVQESCPARASGSHAPRSAAAPRAFWFRWTWPCCAISKARKRLRSGSLTSKAHLQQRIEISITPFNATTAKPFRWLAQVSIG